MIADPAGCAHRKRATTHSGWLYCRSCLRAWFRRCLRWEVDRAQRRKWRQAHPECHAANCAAWRARNPERTREIQARADAKRRGKRPTVDA